MKLAKYPGIKKDSPVAISGTSAPFGLMQRWQREINRLFGDPFGGWLIPDENPFMEDWVPAVNVYEEKDEFVVEAELPGMKKDEIHIYMSGDDLNITGQRKEEREEKGRDAYRSERYFGRFHRVISLPVAVKAEAIEARYRDGVLIVTCPKSEKARASQVDVKVD
ncbi:MAG TPA: Hsp20/alpha crystallin family protein [Candidatus Sulfotelmatobacter sp.]|nr:Hsp20/alpha crystallin family protein [Candidatus Sulfotelmatobacter sp.]